MGRSAHIAAGAVIALVRVFGVSMGTAIVVAVGEKAVEPRNEKPVRTARAAGVFMGQARVFDSDPLEAGGVRVSRPRRELQVALVDEVFRAPQASADPIAKRVLVMPAARDRGL